MNRVDRFGALYEEWQRHGLDRRQFMRLVALGASASSISMIIAACGGSSTKSTSTSAPGAPTTSAGGGATATTAGTPQPIAQTVGTPALNPSAMPTSAPFVDKPFLIALNVEPDSLDVHDTFSNASLGTIKCIYEGLVGLNEKMSVVNQLATSWEASSDAKEFTFKLAKGVKFQDGTPFNAQAVKDSFDRVLAKDSKLKRHGYFSAAIDHVEVVDDGTVKIVSQNPFAAMVATIAHPAGGIASPTAIKKYGTDFGTHPVGTGPYQFSEWVRGDHIAMAPFADYWNKASGASVSKLTVKGIAEPSALGIAVQSGDAQFGGPLNAPQAVQLQKQQGVVVQENPSISVYWITLNNHIKPYDNKMVRQALNYGVNKEEVLKAADLGKGTLMDSPLGQLVYGYHKVGSYAYDPAKAKDLLKQGGYENGFKATLWTSAPSKDRAVAVQGQLQKIGVTIDVVQMESAALNAELAKPVDQSQTQMVVSNWSPSTGDADWGLRPLYTKDEWPPAGATYSFYTNPDVEKYVLEGLQFADETKRLEAYAKAQETIWDDAPNIFLYAPTYFGANVQDAMGVIVQPDGIVYMRSAAYKK
ncbi:MAG TPA: ABC transporter substrate-binding protein [Nitrolancea sp.]|nr:ABC transporter substrate-binding protein [Nitrolancea sp.]